MKIKIFRKCTLYEFILNTFSSVIFTYVHIYIYLIFTYIYMCVRLISI